MAVVVVVVDGASGVNGFDCKLRGMLTDILTYIPFEVSQHYVYLIGGIYLIYLLKDKFRKDSMASIVILQSIRLYLFS